MKRILEADESADNCYQTLQLVVERRDKNTALKIQQLKDALPRYRKPQSLSNVELTDAVLMKQALEYLDQRCKFEHGLQQLNGQYSEAPNDLDRKRL